MYMYYRDIPIAGSAGNNKLFKNNIIIKYIHCDNLNGKVEIPNHQDKFNFEFHIEYLKKYLLFFGKVISYRDSLIRPFLISIQNLNIYSLGYSNYHLFSLKKL